MLMASRLEDLLLVSSDVRGLVVVVVAGGKEKYARGAHNSLLIQQLALTIVLA
jgi:hypothetical protein